MPKHMLVKLASKEQERAEEDRGKKAPVLLARQNRLAKRLGRASRGYVLAGAGVVVGAVVVVSLLSWLAPDSDRPVGHPLEVVGRVADGVLEQVDEQVATLLGTEGGTVLRDVRENLTAVGSRIPWSGRANEITPNRSTVSSSPTAPAPTIHPTLNTPVQEEPPSTATNEPPTTYAPSPSSTSETPPPVAEPVTESQPPATTGEPTTLPPATEESPTPPPLEGPLPTTEEPPPAEEPSAPPGEEPPPAEEPPIEEVPPTGPPPTAEEPAPPPTEEPPPTTDQPPRPPTGLA